MAYLRQIVRQCSRCEKEAAVRLYSARNSHLGDYCRRHGRTALKEQNELEQHGARREDTPNPA